MLYAVLSLFHQVLPFSDTVFRLKELFVEKNDASPTKKVRVPLPSIMKLVSEDQIDANSSDSSMIEDCPSPFNSSPVHMRHLKDAGTLGSNE
jgi:hypothetical protein